MLLGPVMLDIAGTQLSEDDIIRLSHPLTGGVILFTRNYINHRQLTELTQQIHALRSPHLLIAVDHEGGRVQRFRDDFTKLPAMRELGRIWDKQPSRARHLVKQVGFVLAAELNACGVDFSFTPVLDLDYGQSSVIGDRAFHHDSNAVYDLAYNLMLGLKKGGMPAIGKHFPGHGYIQTDSHLEKSIDSRRYNDIEANDLIPFQHMIDAGLVGIMSAHVIYPEIDSKPAGFSKIWLQNILREELRFDGCIFSDDLSMRGAGDYLESMLSRAQAALDAGCDMILVCNNPAGTDQILKGLQWEMSATSLSRFARMHAKNHIGSMTKLRENGDYVRAVREISIIGCESGELPLQ
ncbi:beta-N-acetylhexosaminidase [Nitrosomonas supralitoralis]|uniref:Beta-hexosaminidase n=1 Tax=Nitrosomonas supralitoralis TaxID=2116706 RepID=A0A2P7NUY4_9PROT|nr:beta-N-acetylhexosaminidase [Nitrosomonas supralitoralis]PSJ17284.1 beta-N-acetylhexosaminidase [Nitrosomonas supralitoralis]